MIKCLRQLVMAATFACACENANATIHTYEMSGVTIPYQTQGTSFIGSNIVGISSTFYGTFSYDDSVDPLIFGNSDGSVTKNYRYAIKSFSFVTGLISSELIDSSRSGVILEEGAGHDGIFIYAQGAYDEEYEHLVPLMSNNFWLASIFLDGMGPNTLENVSLPQVHMAAGDFSSMRFEAWRIPPGEGLGSDYQATVTSLEEVGSPLPEPKAWLMMMGGFVAVGALTRRAQRSERSC